jgi:hypothetical protein
MFIPSFPQHPVENVVQNLDRHELESFDGPLPLHWQYMGGVQLARWTVKSVHGCHTDTTAPLNAKAMLANQVRDHGC